jgi:IS5 family transposase
MCAERGTTSTRPPFGVQALPGLPYDGHTLIGQIAQVERLTGEKVARVYVDKGYRGHGLARPEINVTQRPGQRWPTVQHELRRRAAVEPVIGHAKSDGLLERNRLAGACGDAINAVLVGAGHNIRLLLAWLRLLLSLIPALLLAAVETDAPRQSVPSASV